MNTNTTDEVKKRLKLEKWKDTALLIIDVQSGLFLKSLNIYNSEKLLENIGVLIKAAHKQKIPVFYVQHSNKGILKKGTESWEIHHKIKPASVDFIIHKVYASAFRKTSLKEIMDFINIKRLFITGLVSHGCVNATCVEANKLGYKVVLVQDGHSNFNKAAEKIINKTNLELEKDNIELKLTADIDFN